MRQQPLRPATQPVLRRTKLGTATLFLASLVVLFLPSGSPVRSAASGLADAEPLWLCVGTGLLLAALSVGEAGLDAAAWFRNPGRETTARGDRAGFPFEPLVRGSELCAAVAVLGIVVRFGEQLAADPGGPAAWGDAAVTVGLVATAAGVLLAASVLTREAIDYATGSGAPSLTGDWDD